jgi:hypothetical protein
LTRSQPRCWVSCPWILFNQPNCRPAYNDDVYIKFGSSPFYKLDMLLY